jgi:hypothetical protein
MSTREPGMPWTKATSALAAAADLLPLKMRDLEPSFSTPLEFDPETCLLLPSTERLSARLLAVRLVHERGEPRRADIVRDVTTRTGKSQRAVERAVARAIRDGDLTVDGEILRVPAAWERA